MALVDLEDGRQGRGQLIRARASSLGGGDRGDAPGQLRVAGWPHQCARLYLRDARRTPSMEGLPEGLDQHIEVIIERAVDGAGGTARQRHGDVRSRRACASSSPNAGLGRYFGVTEGALVLEVDGERYKGLQPGDVIWRLMARRSRIRAMPCASSRARIGKAG